MYTFPCASEIADVGPGTTAFRGLLELLPPPATVLIILGACPKPGNATQHTTIASRNTKKILEPRSLCPMHTELLRWGETVADANMTFLRGSDVMRGETAIVLNVHELPRQVGACKVPSRRSGDGGER